MEIAGQKWTLWVRDIAIGGLIIAALLMWQSRDMLEKDGSVAIVDQELPTLSGEVQTLLADNKPTLVYFFAPWCQICHLSIGNLSYIDNDNINIVRVALDFNTPEEVAEFARDHEITEPILLGNRQVQQQFNISAYPTYYLVDGDHNIVGGSKGYSTAAGLKLREWLIDYAPGAN